MASCTSGNLSGKRDGIADKGMAVEHNILFVNTCNIPVNKGNPFPIPSRFRQAAASGQPDVSFASEDKNPGDLAREDIRCLIRGLPKVPQEAKAKYRLATSSSNGVHTNCAGFSKVNRMVWCSMPRSSIHQIGFSFFLSKPSVSRWLMHSYKLSIL